MVIEAAISVVPVPYLLCLIYGGRQSPGQCLPQARYDVEQALMSSESLNT